MGTIIFAKMLGQNHSYASSTTTDKILLALSKELLDRFRFSSDVALFNRSNQSLAPNVSYLQQPCLTYVVIDHGCQRHSRIFSPNSTNRHQRHFIKKRSGKAPHHVCTAGLLRVQFVKDAQDGNIDVKRK